jgi:hypothetical protein
MMESEKTLLSRRELGRNAMMGGAGLLLGREGVAAQDAHDGQEQVDARKVGARGDGKTNDTMALQRAIDGAAETSGGVFVPPGIYLTNELHIRPGVSLTGVAAWNYSSGGGSVLRLAGAESSCLLNMTDARGATIDGLSLDGRDLGNGIHGIALNRTQWGKHEDSFRIERCQVAHFSGDGAHLDCVWCFSVRHSMLAYNKGDGLAVRGWDGFILDNWFSGNGRAGYAARRENASITFTANRIEWNGEENMVMVDCDGYQITGNFFDRAGTCGIALRKGSRGCNQVTISGNFIKRSGKLASAESHDSAQVLLEGAQGVTCVGNNLQAGRDDGGQGTYSPSCGIVYQGLENCVVRENVLHHGAMKELMVDLGGHGEGALVSDNPGKVFKPIG